MARACPPLDTSSITSPCEEVEANVEEVTRGDSRHKANHVGNTKCVKREVRSGV